MLNTEKTKSLHSAKAEASYMQVVKSTADLQTHGITAP